MCALKNLDLRPEHGYGSSTNIQKVVNEMEREKRREKRREKELNRKRREKYYRQLQQIHARHLKEKKNLGS